MANRKDEPYGYAKQKLIFLRDMFEEYTDADHGLSMKEIQEKIKAQYDINPDRKTIISDIDILEGYGLDIQRATGRRKDYRLLKGKDDFDNVEVKILIDLVQSSRFLPPSVSASLIRKLEKVSSVHERKKLKRKVIVPNREQSENKSVLYAMDSIHEAIEANKQILFKYYSYDINKKKYYHHWGNTYRVSPYALLFREGVYYLIAIPAKDTRLRMYRVDHMEEVYLSHADRLNEEVFHAVNLEEFANSTFGLSVKRNCDVTLNAHVSLIDAVIDRFGMGIEFTPVTEDIFMFTVSVTLSPEFYGWVVSFGGRMKIVAPRMALWQFHRITSKCSDYGLHRSASAMNVFYRGI